ncbi:MarR family winged helix-turn-helix transcriptional regulator [Megasphaera elsdenii]|uniref:MarR family winged helix-turn-helix transcriptional regulator n=1 Tax=Megasphaera elsdenii TaxID=907 RepID=UPI0039F583B6
MTDKSSCNPLLLGNQLCFPLYASARKIVAAYNPFLKEIGLTYPQYVTMMVLWEEKKITMHDLRKRLYLDSGTLTPVLKKLENMGYVTRSRKPEDERVVIVEITPEGQALREKAEKVPYAMGCLVNRKGELFTPEEVETLKKQLYRLIHALE